MGFDTRLGMIAIIDYNAGNLRSVLNAFEAIGQKAKITKDPKEIANCAGIVLPGVGAFGKCIESLKEQGLLDVLNEEVLVKKKPYLGICLGLQFLAHYSNEHGYHEGFGWLDAGVEKIVPDDPKFRIPHIGWNNITVKKKEPLFTGIEDPVVYFVHSYRLMVENGNSSVVSSICWHGTEIVASVQKENIFAVQFHPEKSQQHGLKILENFSKLL